MPINKKWSSIERAREDAPTGSGIYEFGLIGPEETEIIYIGRGEGDRGIRARVIAHINGSEAGNKSISSLIRRHGSSRIVVRWEECGPLGSAVEMEQDHCGAFHRLHGTIPRCNTRMEMEKDALGDFLKKLFGK
jgi:hypothetical protein